VHNENLPIDNTFYTDRLHAYEELQISMVRNFTIPYRVARAIHEQGKEEKGKEKGRRRGGKEEEGMWSPT
jgi:hypothetical protein